MPHMENRRRLALFVRSADLLRFFHIKYSIAIK